MIETNEPTEGTVVKQETPAQITTTMILEDLDNGIGRDGIKEKYSLETWEVSQIFQHPKLKGKKAKKIRKLSFEFVDDTVPEYVGSEEEKQDKSYTYEMDSDPNQTDLETAIEEVETEELETFDSEDEETEETEKY